LCNQSLWFRWTGDCFLDLDAGVPDVLKTVARVFREAATKEAVLQLKRYMDVFTIDENREVRGILVAPELARGAQKMLASLGLEFKSISPQRCSEILKSIKTKQLTDFFQA